MAAFTILRVKEICFRHFRGFTGTKKDLIINKEFSPRINTDADIVILTGPNGYGKSSFLEGVLLLLTGFHYYYDPNDLISLNKDNFCVEGIVETDKSSNESSGDALKNEIIITCTIDDILKNELGWQPKNYPVSYAIKSKELNARICGFFQDKVEKLFDEETQGKTLGEISDPISEYIKAANNGLKSSIVKFDGELLDKEKELQWQGKSFEELTINIKNEWNKFNDLLIQAGLRNIAHSNTEKINTPEDIADAITEKLYMDGRTGNRDDDRLIKTFYDICIGSLKNLLKQLGKNQKLRYSPETSDKIKKLEQLLEYSDKRIQSINKNHENLEKDVSLFGPFCSKMVYGEEAASLPAILNSLVKNAGYWLNNISASCSEKFAKILEELKAFDIIEAEKERQKILAWLEPKIQILKEKNYLEDQRGKISNELEKSGESKEIRELQEIEKELNEKFKIFEKNWKEYLEYRRWEKKIPDIKKDMEHIKLAREFITKYLEKYNDLVRPDQHQQIMDHIKDMLNQVISRFSLADGFLPMRLKPDDKSDSSKKYKIVAHNGRELVHFSTGQKSQVAVAYLTAQNQSLSPYLNHRIIILDDVTTSYDLSNLTREAILWRQLAYTDNQQQKRQIFISSHHEDLTNHLLELLVPPGDKKMRLIRFVGWSAETGPELEAFDIISTQKVIENDKHTDISKGFANDLKELQWLPD